VSELSVVQKCGGRWPKQFIDRVLDEFPDDEQIRRTIASLLLVDILADRLNKGLGNLPDLVTEAVIGIESPASKVYIYKNRLKEAVSRIERIRGLHSEAQAISSAEHLAA
jgi:hypothetical protein